MIVDVLANSERIEGLNPYFKVVFDYIKTHDLASMPVGRIDIDGDNAYLKIEDAKGRKIEEAVYERHDKYIDIQMPLSTPEGYGWKAKRRLGEERAPYDGAGDFTFYRDPVERGVHVISRRVRDLFPGRCSCSLYRGRDNPEDGGESENGFIKSIRFIRSIRSLAPCGALYRRQRGLPLKTVRRTPVTL